MTSIFDRYSRGFIQKNAIEHQDINALYNNGWRNEPVQNPPIRTMSTYSSVTDTIYMIEIIPYGNREYIALYVDGEDYNGDIRSVKDLLNVVKKLERRR